MMKKIALIAVAFMLLAAVPALAEKVDSTTAHNRAANFLLQRKTSSSTGGPQKAPAKAPEIRQIECNDFQNFYVFGNDNSFVIVSADDCVQPILGYSTENPFGPADEMPDHVRWWLQGYNVQIADAVAAGQEATKETSAQWEALESGTTARSLTRAGTAVVGPLLQTKWNQNKYYNDLCPPASGGPDGKAYTGCVATAMAQIMKYWNYPSTGIGSHSYSWNGQTLSANFGATAYDWNNMAAYYEYYFENGTDQYANPLPIPSAEEIAAVATLMYHCGVSVNMNYGGTGGSGANSRSVATALVNYFNYKSTAVNEQKSSYTDSAWIAMLKAELNANRPLLYSGRNPNPNTNSGHAFVCDGYDDSDCFHFNWGWAGHYNGYFSLGNLAPKTTSEAGSGSGDYTADQEAIFGIEPGSMVAAPTNLSYTLSGLQDITLTWDAVSAASSYNVYRNGNLVGNTTETTYSETAPFGELSYYVRCVDANSQLSLPSNTVTVTINYPTPTVNDLTATLSEGNVNLLWSAPEWCYPETPTATLTYGDGNIKSLTTIEYWAHRYLSDNLSQYANKAIYKISFYAYETGSYTCYIYKGATEQSYSSDNIFFPSTLVTSKTIEVTSTSEWIDIDLDELVAIDGQNDIWVIMNDPNNGNGRYSAAFSTNTGSNNHGGYWGKWNFGDEKGYVLDNSRAFLIRTYVTDGTYTYNLYRDGKKIAEALADTCYTDSNPANNATNKYTVTTNYYGGESALSNMVGVTLGNASLSNLTLDENDKMIVEGGSVLTVTGTLANENPENLIIEDGAQLVHDTEGVKATVKKNIAAYTAEGTSDGWRLIASPIVGNLDSEQKQTLLNGTYDLYYYHEPDYTWKNYKPAPFDVQMDRGYLYANSAATTLKFAGELKPSNNSVIIKDLSYSAQKLKGFNLVGNPFACNAMVDKPFYVMNDDGSEIELAASGRQVLPCEGVFVKATESDKTVTFTRAASAQTSAYGSDDYATANPPASIDFVVSQGEANLDRARVRVGKEEGMEKFSLGGKSAKLTFLQNGKEYAVTYVSEKDETVLNFQPVEDGSYTLAVEAEALVGVDYLHLIDELAGKDVDLLLTPSYSFEAKTADAASRFRIVLDASARQGETANEPFVQYADGRFHIFNMDGEATVQVIDMAGRILANERRNATSFTLAISDLQAGVYIVRLMKGGKTVTQKVAIY